MKKIENISLREKIALEIKNAILSGEIKAGTQLTQEKIAADLGVSRMPVREALLALEKENFIEFTPTKKAVVLPFSMEDVHEHYWLRANLESECAFMAATSEGDLSQLAQLHTEMLNCSDYGKYLALNQQFHHEIHALSKLKKTVRLIESLWGTVPPIIRKDHAKYVEKSNSEHASILSAIQSKQPELARELMQKHIMRSYRDFVDQEKNRS